MRAAIVIVIAAAAAVGAPAAAADGWQASGPGLGYAAAATMPPGATPTATVSGREVIVSWTAGAGAVPVDGYLVRRYDANGHAEAIGVGCSGTVAATSCTEHAVPAGTWRYTIVAAHAGWRGAESPASEPAAVSAPSLTLAPAAVNELPAALSGTLASFAAAQTVTFRLDDPATGTTLAGAISPTPVPLGGGASVSVTLPGGVADGAHTIYAIGSAGDIAGAPVDVDTTCSLPGPQTVTANRDAYVDSLLTAQNFGSDAALRAQPAYLLGLVAAHRTLVGFDLPPIPARCTLAGATLRLYATAPTSGRTIHVLRLNGAWTEPGVTWGNQPATTGTASTSPSRASAGWQDWSVLDQVQAMYAGSNHGFLVKDAADSVLLLPPSQAYQSRDTTPAQQIPQLVLDFE